MDSVYNGRGGKKNAPKIRDMNSSAVLIWFDPGKTTGWSVFQIHPEALVDPDALVMGNVEHWEHGQIDCGARRGLDDVRDIFDGNGRLEYSDLGVNSLGEMTGVHEMLEMVDGWLGSAVGLEDYIVRSSRKDRDTISPVRITSAFDYGMFQRGFQTFRQQPSEAKGIVTDERLENWGYYRRDGQEHARDADRHAITWLRKVKTKKKLREACWPHLYGKYQILERGKYVEKYGPYYIPPGHTWKSVQEAWVAKELAKVKPDVQLKVHSSAMEHIAKIGEYEYPAEASVSA